MTCFLSLLLPPLLIFISSIQLRLLCLSKKRILCISLQSFGFLIRSFNLQLQFSNKVQLASSVICLLSVWAMASKDLRRRLHHGDLDGRSREQYEASRFDSLNEPLLGQYYEDDKEDEPKEGTSQDQWDDERRKEHLHWTLLFSKLIAQWIQWLKDMILGSGSLIGRFLPLPFLSQNGPAKNYLSLSPLQEERLRILRQRVEIPFDGSLLEHQDALRQLWRLAYPERELPSLKSELWKDMGWQGSDPSTDFRGGGFISLENLIFFAQNYPESFQRLLHKRDGVRSEWEYPFAVAGINISFMLVQMLDLQSEKPSSLAGKKLLELLGEDEMAFENLYCITFQMMDGQWLAKRASYMEFNEVLKSTRLQLERDLSVENVFTVKDLPGYGLLKWDPFLSN